MKKKKTDGKAAQTKKKRSRGRIVLKVLGTILCVLVVFVGITTLITIFGNRATMNKAKSFPKVQARDSAVTFETDEDGTQSFITDRPFKILQLTDIHIGGGWMSLKKDAMALNAVAAMVTAEKPDLVIVTGDVSYPVPFQAGTFNNKSSAKIFANLMESLGVYWTLTFGNHDTEAYSYFSRDTIGDLYESEEYRHCLFQKGPEEVDGVGNHIINIKNSKNEITQTLFMLDSHSYTDGDIFGIMWKYDNIHENQVEWYSETLDKLNKENNETLKANGKEPNSAIKSLAFFHIPLTEQKKAWDEYAANGYKDTDDVKLIYGVAGETGKVVFCGMNEDNLFEKMQEKGSTQGVFFGHDHYNNLSFNYKGIRLTYGKSVDYLAYPGIYKEGTQRGCTVIEVNPDSTFDCKAESYYQDKYASLYEKEEVTMQEFTYPQEAIQN